MQEEMLELPKIKEIKEMLSSAREEIQAEVEENSELLPTSQFLNQIIDIIEEKLNQYKDLNKLDLKKKIDIAAHLNFLEIMKDDFFFNEDFDFDEDSEYDEDNEYFDEEEEED